MNDTERFWSKVDKTDTCWLWTASIGTHGYGLFSAGYPMVGAHRYAYELTHGPIPDGLDLDHLCRVRHCVNPAHLEAVTPRENILRGDGLAAHNARKTHCKHGHEFDEANTYIYPSGDRGCRACARAADRQYRERRRAAHDALTGDKT